MDYTSYHNIRQKVDKKVDELTQLHQHHLNCKKGCDLCCYSFRVFPIEFYAMADQLGLKPVPDTNASIGDRERCAFLSKGACTIYDARPIICRTHGLPLLNMDEEGENYELSFCELNFIDADDDEFGEENVFVQDKTNAMLYEANKAFLEQNPHLGLKADKLIAIRELRTT